MVELKLLPHQAVPVPIIHSALGRAEADRTAREAFLLLDLKERPDLVDVINQHRSSAEGECGQLWTIPDDLEDQVWLVLHFKKPTEGIAILSFECPRQGLMIDALVRRTPLRLIPGESGERLSEMAEDERPQLRVEITAEFPGNWEEFWAAAAARKLDVPLAQATALVKFERMQMDVRLMFPDSPPLQKVVDLFVEPSQKAVIFVTDDMLINQIRRDNPKVAEEFDPQFEEELALISRDFSQTAGLILKGMIREESSVVRAIGALLANAINAVPAAFDLIRLGYRLQPAATLRVALETTAMAAWVAIDNDRMEPLVAGKLKSTQAIGPAKQVVPFIGELYGYLSQQFTHVGPLFMELQKNLPYGGEDIAIAKTNLLIVQGTLIAIGMTAEIAFYESVGLPRYWQQKEPGEFHLSLRPDVQKTLDYLSERLSTDERSESETEP